MKTTIFLASILFATACQVPAQSGPMDNSGAALIKFFGANNAFSADCDLKVTSATKGVAGRGKN